MKCGDEVLRSTRKELKMKASAIKRNVAGAVIALLLGIVASGLFSVLAMNKPADERKSAASEARGMRQSSKAKRNAGVAPTSGSNREAYGRPQIRGDWRAEADRGKTYIRESLEITLEQAKSDPRIKFLMPKVLPDRAELKAIVRIPGDGWLLEPETVQIYFVDGKPFLEVGAMPAEKAPDYKALAEKGSVQVRAVAPDGTPMNNPDGSPKMVKADNTEFITVNGHPGNANEPTVVDNSRLGGAIRNPGLIYWYSNGTIYTVKADMPVSELLRIAESME